MRQRTGLVVAITVAVLLAVGIVYQLADGGPDGNASPASSTTTAPIGSTSVPIDDEAAPRLVNTGEDFGAIIRSFIAHQDWVAAHPDPVALTETMAESCPCLVPSQKNTEELKTKGWRYEAGVGTEVQQVKPNPVTADVVDVFVVLRYPERKVLDSTGSVVKVDPPEPPTSYFYTLRRGGDGRWRITEIELGTVL